MSEKGKAPVVVIDLGFSAAKYKFGDRKGRVPSALRRHNEMIVVGDEALRGTGSNYLKTPEELVRFYPNFVDHVVELLDVAEKVDLSIGLPYAFWKNEMQKADNEMSAIDHLKKVLVVGNIGKVHVFPQGRGGIVSYLMEAEKAPEGNLLALDIGFNTIIATLYSVASQKTIWDETYYKKGIHRMVTEYLLPKIKHHLPGRSLTPVELSYFLETRFIQFGFERIEIGPEIDASAERYAADTLSDIVNDLRGHAGVTASFNEVLMFGGGTHYLPEVKSQTVRMTKLQEPEFANARGFEVLAQNHAKEG